MKKLIFSAASFFLIFEMVFAAGGTYSISPASGEFSVGQTIKTSVYVHSGGNSINAAEATINFPASYLRVASIVKAESVFSLWPTEPTFDNLKGLITFAGGTAAPFSCSQGEVLSVTFHVKQAGEGALNFSSARILLADGLGTDIFGGALGANWRFIPPFLPKPTPAPPVLPSAPVIVSSSHPDQNSWYSNNNPKFTWELPKDVTAVRVLYDQFADAQPTLVYEPLISERELGGVQDGVWYFHVQFRNPRGWGTAEDYRVQIDTIPPESFIIQFPDGRETFETEPRIGFSTTDSLSGIDRYEVKIGEGNFFNAEGLKQDKGFYVLPPQPVGERQITVKAFDKAGNAIEVNDLLIVKPGVLNYLKIAIAIAIILALFAFIIWNQTRRKIRHKVLGAESATDKIFDDLKENFEKQFERLEELTLNRMLIDEERALLRKIMKELEAAEKSLRKIIKNISDRNKK